MKTNLKRVSKRSLALILGILMLFSTLMVGSISTTNAMDGNTIYFVNIGKWSSLACHNWNDSTSTTWPGTAMTKTDYTYNNYDIYMVDINDGSTKCIFNDNTNDGSKTGDLTIETSLNQPCYDGSNWVELSSLTNGINPTLLSVLKGEKVMVYGGEKTGWGQTTFHLMNSDSTGDSEASGSMFGSYNFGDDKDNTYEFAALTVPTGSYYMGHWASGLQTTIEAGGAYIVSGITSNSEFTQKANSGDNYIYKADKGATTTADTTISSNITVGQKLSVSTSTSAGISAIGETNSFKYYLYNGENYQEVTLIDNMIDTSELPAGDNYKLLTVLCDGRIYVLADTDDLTISNTSTTATTAPTETTSPTDPTTPAETTTYYISGAAVGGWGGDNFIELTKNGELYTKTFNSESDLAQNKQFMLYNDKNITSGYRVDLTPVNSDSVEFSTGDSGYGEQNILLSLKSGYQYPIELSYNSTTKELTATAVKYYNITTSASHATVYVDSQALAGANVEFSVIASSGYKITGVSIDGAAQTLNDTNTYSFEMPEKDVEITVTTERNADVPINKYYIRGYIDGYSGLWDDSEYKPLTVSEDGYYEYYQTSQNAEFLLYDKSESPEVEYKSDCVDSLFNGTDLEVTKNYNNAVVNSTANHYIIVYYPNTVANNTDAPKICAATELPNGINKTVEIIAKDGSNVVGSDTGFAKTTISSENFTSDDITTNDNNQRANIKVGNSVEITTTIPDGYKDTYFVKGWCVNGKTYGLNADNTVSVDGSYTFTLPVTPGLDINDKIEITPVFFVATESATESNYITFYVEGFDDSVKKTWGDTIACYSYYYVNGDKANGTNRLLGNYPGQPLLADSTGRYFMQVAKADNDGNAISGITMSSYGSDSIHSEVTGVGNLQTYDYDDFSRIVEANPNATNIVFSFKLREGNNSPAASYATDEDMLAAGVTGFEDLKTYNGSMSNIFYDAIDVTANTPVLYVVSNGYDGSSVIGEFPTSWHVYTKGSDGVYTKLATLPPSALVYNTSDDLQKSTLSEYLSAYKALEDYKEYAVKISYEGNNAPPSDWNKGDVKRCDGKWYYTETGAPISSNIIIQYEDKDNRGTYKEDTFSANGLGENTGANAFFTNAEAEDHLYETTVDNNDTYNFSAYAYATTYKFVGWYVASTDGGEPTLITTSTEGEATRNASFTFIARYEYVDQSLTLNLEYKFMEYNGSSISYDSKYDGSSDVEHTYSKSTTVLETVVTDSAALKDLVKRLAPIIQSDYYDYTLNESSIKVSYNAQTGIVSATASYDDTPHIYTVSVNGELIHGYYQNIITLNSMDFVDFASLDECATKGALWYYVNPEDSTDSVLYYDKPALDYRFVVDGAILDVDKGDGTSLDGTSNIVNSYYELISEGVDTGASSTHKLTQNFYITDYLDYAYTEDGAKLDDTAYVNYLGGGIIFFGSDKDGNLVTSKKDYEDKANRRDLIKSIVGDGKADISHNEGGIGCLYTLYSAHPDQYRYSNALLAYQSIKSIVVNNTSANDGRYFTAYSFFVYEYELSDGTKGTTFSLSDNGATANAYIPVV